MNRYAIENLFGIEGLNIAWYGLIIACGMAYGNQITNPSLCFFPYGVYIEEIDPLPCVIAMILATAIGMAISTLLTIPDWRTPPL